MQADRVDVGQLERRVRSHRKRLRERRVSDHDQLDPVAREKVTVRKPVPYDVGQGPILLIGRQGRELLLQLGSRGQRMRSRVNHRLRCCRGGETHEQQCIGDQDTHSGFSRGMAKRCRQAISYQAQLRQACPEPGEFRLSVRRQQPGATGRATRKALVAPLHRLYVRMTGWATHRIAGTGLGEPTDHCSPTCSIKSEAGRATGNRWCDTVP